MEVTPNEALHERDHGDINLALTPSRRRWLICVHLKRFHGFDASSFADPESFHDDRHYDELPSVRLARAQRQMDALIWAVSALSEVDAEAGLLLAKAAIARLGSLDPARPDHRQGEGHS